MEKKVIKGGQFLIEELSHTDVFVPEEWSEEQKMMADTCDDFLEKEVAPNIERIDALEEGLMPSLLEKAGELGLLSISIPEQYGGFGGDFLTSLYTTERLGQGHSFSVALAAHTGIGTLPILYFGNESQKQKYLPKLASGEWKASYCLTEPNSGSDALAAKTKAELTKDGNGYVLNGQKMWITNAGFADVFIVFAKIDGEHFTGFIVEKGTEGLTLGNEEHKLGIKGSSTRQVFLSNVVVPKENVLGEIGKGHLIAFNILNIGRIKLAGAALGASKQTASLSVQYANERNQFNMPISKFGAIKHKLAEQAIRIWAVESAIYRASNDIKLAEEKMVAEGMPYEEAILQAAKEFAIECALLKVAGSEVLDYVVDEGVQVYGGYGYSADFPMERAYRDSRINRIFEGTNEINRMLILDMLLKKGLSGELDLMTPALAVQKELMSVPDFGEQLEGLFAKEKKALKNVKKAILMAAGAAVQKFQKKLALEQELLMNLSDMIIELYQAEASILRAEKIAVLKGEDQAKLPIAIAKTFLFDAMDRINKSGKDAIISFTEGDEQRMMLLGLKRFTKIEPYNTKEARRAIADTLIKENRYSL